MLNLVRSTSNTAAHGVSSRQKDKPLKLRDPRMPAHSSTMGGSIAEVDEINCEDVTSTIKSAENNNVRT